MRLLIFIFSTLLLSASVALAQIDVLGKVKEKVKERTEQKTDETIDKGLDKVEEGVEGQEEEKQETEQEQETEQTEEKVIQKNDVQQEKKAGLKSYSKYDFIAGEKTVFFDDFSQDNLGDFPVKWNTNSSGEVVELEGFGKWFWMNWGGTFYPEMSGVLPENFTIEFDLINDFGDETYGPFVNLDIYSTIPDEPMDNLVPGNGGVEIKLGSTRVDYFSWKDQNYTDISNSTECNVIEKKENQIVRVSIMVQKQRFRAWLDEVKVVDIPRMMPPGLTFDRVRFFEWGEIMEGAKFYIKNFRIAAGVPDMRSKLITEGKLVTHGIYFDSGSDKIKPESYGTLKGVANVLKENPDVRVTIVGHTDSDGNDASNLDLSKRRSLSVKNALMSEFGIDASRMETDGKGESQPMDNNTSAEGKANNRRVEFIKI